MTLLACYILASKRRYFIKPYPQPTFLRRLCEKNNKKPFPIFYLKKVLFHGDDPLQNSNPGPLAISAFMVQLRCLCMSSMRSTAPPPSPRPILRVREHHQTPIITLWSAPNGAELE